MCMVRAGAGLMKKPGHNMNLPHVALGLAMMMFISHSSSAEEVEMAVAAGQAAPDFSLRDQNGETRTLSAYRRHWVVLYFYPKDDTPGCTQEACRFRDDLPALRKLEAEVLGVSVDNPARSGPWRLSALPNVTASSSIRRGRSPRSIVRCGPRLTAKKSSKTSR